MPGNVILSINVPAGTCYVSPAIDWPLLVSLITANLTGSLGLVNEGSSTPSAADRNKPWLRSNADGSDDGQWTYYNGFWVQKHALPTNAIILFLGALADIDTFDGGEVAAITNMAGPFWARATEFDARSPIGPGTLPSGVVINVLDNIGEEKHVQLSAELVEHSHPIKTSQDGSIAGDGGRILNAPETAAGITNQGSATDNTGGNPPSGMNVIQPSVGAWFIKRTARIYRRRNA